ncbi:MAG: hypothetical protein AAGH15_08680 [Myxococcota bacterium]
MSRPIVVAGADLATLDALRTPVARLGELRFVPDDRRAFDLCTAKPRPRLAIVDASRRGLRSLQLVARLKRDPRTQSIPLVLVMAQARPAAVVAGINAGARAILRKPLREADVNDALRRALGARRSDASMAL